MYIYYQVYLGIVYSLLLSASTTAPSASSTKYSLWLK